jgi:uncharacterized membrane protein YagU involved in acid resistance
VPDRKVGTVRETVTISYRGANYELGRGNDFYGVWVVGAPRDQPSERWPATTDGWQGAWTRFSAIEVPGTIVQTNESSTKTAAADQRAFIAAGLLGVGVLSGIIGLFPDYLAGSSLAQQPSELVAHAIYLATWSASALLIVLGGSRLRIGALLGLGTSIVTFGLFFADAGTTIAGGAHLMGAGLVLSLLGWVACAAGGVMAFGLRLAGAPGRPQGHAWGRVLALALAAAGAAAAFAPSWDSFTLRTAAGASNSVTEGNAFSSPGAVIAGDLAVMIALVVVVVAAAVWRPTRLGATLLAGALIPMVAQAISALVQLGQSVSPSQFGISSAEAARAGVTISSGVTLDFWIFCAFVVALIVMGVAMLIPPRQPALNHMPSPTTTFS